MKECIVATHRDGEPNDDVRRQAPGSKSPPSTGGTLMVDGTCVPADIAYPTDLRVPNHAREIAEYIIDVLHEPHVGT